MPEDQAITTHPQPAWRDRANFIVMADLADHGLPGGWEQLWVRDEGDGRFELCCLPFLVYGLALGDTVSLRRTDEFAYVVDRVVARSGRRCLRVAIVGPDSSVHEQVHGEIALSGLAHEWRGFRMVAIDVDGQLPGELEGFLGERVREGQAEWEWA